MNTNLSKQLCLAGRIGPAFEKDDIATAHLLLDGAGVPRTCAEDDLSLQERIAYLIGMLSSAREAMAQAVQLQTLSNKVMNSLYPQSEVGS